MDALELLNKPLTWTAIGIILLIAESLSGEGLLLAFGISGLVIALLLWVTGLQIGPLWLIVLFAVVGVIVSMATRRILQKTERLKDDINTF